MKKIYTLDAETDPFEYGRIPKPFVWGLYDGETFIYFWGDNCTQQLMEHLQDEEDIIIYAHNGGKFDYFFLLLYLDPDLFIINGRLSKCSIFSGRIELRDSFLILPLPLSANEKDTFDYSKMEAESRGLFKQEIINYLNTDCRSLWEWVTNFRDTFGGGLTLAGAAFKQLRKTGYIVENTYEDYDERFRRFYFGGRVQCFEVGHFSGDLQYVDINSAYSYAMKFKHWQGSGYIELNDLPSPEKNGSWYAEILATSKGALPYRGDDDKLYFPDDNVARRYFASGWEINAGLETNTLTVHKTFIVFKPTLVEDFSEYVDKFFAMKSEADKSGDKTKRQFAKLMLNSCYGKFGQDGRKFEKFCITEVGMTPEDEHDDWEIYHMDATHWIYSRPDPANSFYNVATAASITAFVRAYLWRAICNSERPLYCDTDSIICYQFNGAISSNLGDWALEAEATDAYIAQRKMYGLALKNDAPCTCSINSIRASDCKKHKIASKGVRLNFHQIKNGVETGHNIVSERDAPAFSLKHGARFFTRETNFENLQKNACNNPP